MKRLPYTQAALPLLLALVLLGGCGHKEAKDTQVAAKVNGKEITVSQVNFALSRLGQQIPQDKLKQVGAQALNSIIDQTLLEQAAVKDKLDRDPQVLQAIEAAKLQILAQAYAQKQTTGVAKPTDADIAKYYNDHPDLFAQRKIYKLQELQIQAKPEQIDAIKQQLTSSGNMGDFVNWLKGQNIPFQGGETVQAAEQIPLPLLDRLSKLNPGQAALVNNNGTLLVIVVAATQPQPVTLDQAKPQITAFLTNQAHQKALADLIKQLKDSGKIEYLGEFADAGKAAEAPSASSDDQGAAPAPAAAPSPSDVSPGQSSGQQSANDVSAPNSVLQKGAAGLK